MYFPCVISLRVYACIFYVGVSKENFIQGTIEEKGELWLTKCDSCMHAQSRLTLATPWTIACQAPLSMGFSRQAYWSGLPFPPPGDLPYPGIDPASLVFPALAGGFFTTAPCGKPILVRGINQIILLVLGISTRIRGEYIIDASCLIMINVGQYMKIRVVRKKKKHVPNVNITKKSGVVQVKFY